MRSLFTAFLLLIFSVEIEAADLLETDNVAIATSYSQSCAIVENTFTCWGEGKKDRAPFDPYVGRPQLLYPTQISSIGDRYSCALDYHVVKCWGQKEYIESMTPIPTLRRPKQIIVNGWMNCALDDDGVKCWGDRNKFSQLKAPRLQNPRQISMSNKTICALDDNGVKCWGDNKLGLNNVPQLRHPKQVVAGGGSVCALDDNGVKCWGKIDFDIPKLLRPTKISGAGGTFCAIDAGEVKCWGDEFDWRDSFNGVPMPKFVNPTHISVASGHACAVDDVGIKCWGYNLYGQTSVPTELRDLRAIRKIITFDLNRLETSYAKLSQYVYRGKKIVLESLSKEIAKFPVAEDKNTVLRLFSLYAIEPLVASITSEIVAAKVLPSLTSTKESSSQKLGIKNINDFELSKDIIDISFVLIESSLVGAKSSIADPERQDLQDLMLEIAQIKAATSDLSETARLLTAALDQHQSLMATLIQNESTSGFGKTILGIQSYLRSK